MKRVYEYQKGTWNERNYIFIEITDEIITGVLYPLAGNHCLMTYTEKKFKGLKDDYDRVKLLLGTHYGSEGKASLYDYSKDYEVVHENPKSGYIKRMTRKF